MTKLQWNAALLIIFSLLLIACGGGGSSTTHSTGSGGGTNNITLGGDITGNTGTITLSINGVNETFSTSAFTFTQTLSTGSQYIVLFVSSTTNQQCIVGNGLGTANANITNLTITCNDAITTLVYPFAEVTGIMTTGDFDGDGSVDIVFTIRTLPGHPSGTNIDMFRFIYGNGSGGFSAGNDRVRLGSSDSGDRRNHLVTGDFNNDGIDDIAFAAGNVLELIAGSATRTHTAIYQVNEVTRVVGDVIHALDVDDDTYLDLLTVDGSLINLTTNAATNFDNDQLLANFLVGIINFTTGDFTGDGRADILGIASNGPSALALFMYEGNNIGGFNALTSAGSLSNDLFLGGSVFDTASKELAAADFDGDGDLDVAITSTTDFLQIMLNDGSGTFSEGQKVIIGNRPIHVRAADFDGDGEFDLATLNQDSKTVHISIGNGDGTFANNTGGNVGAISIPLDSDVDLFDMDVADIDKDGTLDIILAEDGTNPPNTGRGSIQIFLDPTN